MANRIVGARNRLGGMALSRFDAGVRLRAAIGFAVVAPFHKADSARAAARVFEIPRLLDSRRFPWALDRHHEAEKHPLPSRLPSRIIRPDAGNLNRSRIRFKEAKSMKRGSSSSRFNWLSKTGCNSEQFYLQHDETEFPMASQTDCNFWIRDSRAADCVRLGRTLRPLNNLVKIEDQHELAFIREKPAPWARSVSTQGRARTFSRAATTAASEAENILATHRRIFRWGRWRPKKTSAARA